MAYLEEAYKTAENVRHVLCRNCILLAQVNVKILYSCSCIFHSQLHVFVHFTAAPESNGFGFLFLDEIRSLNKR